MFWPLFDGGSKDGLVPTAWGLGRGVVLFPQDGFSW